jgi:hypothetical protein
VKILPCRKGCHGSPAIAVKATANRVALYHTAGFLSLSPFRYLCRGCGQPNEITQAEFASLPEMTDDEIIHPSCDIHPSTVDPTRFPAPAKTQRPPINPPSSPKPFPKEGSIKG